MTATTPDASSPATTDATDAPLVTLSDVKKWFPIKRGIFQRTIGQVQAVDGVSLDIPTGVCVGLVGESGSGKTTLGRIAIRLIDPSEGSITFAGKDTTKISGSELRAARRHMQMVFQDPYSSLDPRNSVGDAVAEPVQTHTDTKRSNMDDKIVELFEMVGINPAFRRRYPREFSGGQLQRIAIARALATNPQLIVLDEAVSSLDVSTRAEMINLLAELQRNLGISYLFIAHDLAIVRHASERIAIMYLGRIVEEGETETVYLNPRHPYTQALLSAIPIPDPVEQRKRKRIVLEGDLPSPINPPSGCRFHTRCPYVMDVCREIDPPYSFTDDGVRVACHLYPSAPGPVDEGGNAAPDVQPGIVPVSFNGGSKPPEA